MVQVVFWRNWDANPILSGFDPFTMVSRQFPDFLNGEFNRTHNGLYRGSEQAATAFYPNLASEPRPAPLGQKTKKVANRP
jgi:hypothetical protein